MWHKWHSKGRLLWPDKIVEQFVMLESSLGLWASHATNLLLEFSPVASCVLFLLFCFCCWIIPADPLSPSLCLF